MQQHTGQRLVDIEGLREKLQCICQWRSRQRVPQALATELQWVTLCNVIELAEDS